MQWLKNEFLPESFDEMNREVEKRREKTKDLFFYPYLAGSAVSHLEPERQGRVCGTDIGA